jgi:hypothetical protein
MLPHDWECKMLHHTLVWEKTEPVKTRRPNHEYNYQVPNLKIQTYFEYFGFECAVHEITLVHIDILVIHPQNLAEPLPSPANASHSLPPGE